MIEIGIITKPQGLKGQFRVNPNSFSFEYFKKLKVINFNNADYKVEKCIMRNTFCIFKVGGIDTIEQVELLRNQIVSVEDKSIDLSQNEYFINDLISCKVFDELGSYYGEVVEINNFGTADVITLKFDKKEIMFPFLNKVINRVDVKNKKIVVNKATFDEISYEN